jgi:geranylgeranyl diphosphate synthase, type II
MATTQTIDIAEVIKSTAEQTDIFLKQWLGSLVDAPPLLIESIQYSLFGPGKRIRPALAILSCQAVGGKVTDALPAAGALELIHCFSLVHDDLPAMDDDDLRRGRPTNHKVYGEAVAILAGDAMNTMAFELLAARVSDPALGLKLVAELAAATGPVGMVGGQVLDTCYPQEKASGAAPAADLEKLQRIHRMKTGALITAACRMGAISGRVDDARLQIIDALGRSIGLAFQIVDDLLDVTASEAQLGKRAGKDAQIGKLTYPVLLGIEETRRHLAQQQEIAEKLSAKLGPAAQPLALLAQSLAKRDR